jgi:hypothetical protein
MKHRSFFVAALALLMLLATATRTPDAARAGTRGRVVVAAGDIACGSPPAPCPQGEDGATADLIADIGPNAVLALGDTQYPHGEYAQYIDNYDTTWGRFLRKTHPVIGNHEYGAGQNGRGFFRYFGGRAHGPKGYYSFNLGKWHLIALNSRRGEPPARAQVRWLIRDLAKDRHRCELAYMHYPRWSSGNHEGSHPNMQRFWKPLVRHGVEAVLGGHDHNYERFAPMGIGGNASRRGTMQFVVGTGGYSLNPFDPALPTSRVRLTEFGVLRLALQPRSFNWSFQQIDGTVGDSGRRRCHA